MSTSKSTTSSISLLITNHFELVPNFYVSENAKIQSCKLLPQFTTFKQDPNTTFNKKYPYHLEWSEALIAYKMMQKSKIEKSNNKRFGCTNKISTDYWNAKAIHVTKTKTGRKQKWSREKYERIARQGWLSEEGCSQPFFWMTIFD